MTIELLFLVQLACCLFMSGVIAMIQVVHYPMFLVIRPEEFLRFHRRHTAWMVLIVGPVMIVELITAAALAMSIGGGWWLNLAGVIVLWMLTFFVSVPLHRRLESGFDPSTVRRLVLTNWPRTVLWLARTAGLVAVTLSSVGLHGSF